MIRSLAKKVIFRSGNKSLPKAHKLHCDNDTIANVSLTGIISAKQLLTATNNDSNTSDSIVTNEHEQNDYDVLINCTNDLLWSVSSDFKLIAANKAFIKEVEDRFCIVLKPGDQLLIGSVFSKKELAFWEACYKRALSGESFHEEFYTPASNTCKEAWTDTSFNPICKDGIVTGTNCHTRNITEKKITEEKIRQSEFRLSEAQELAKVGSWETDLKTFNVLWSQETYRIFEIDPNKFQASHPGFLEFVHPEEREKVDEAFINSLYSNSVNAIEHRILTGKGHIKFVEERWRIFQDKEGTPARAVGTCQDITERKNTEAAINKANHEKTSILESIDDGFFAIDKNSLVTYWNRKAEELLGEKREDIIGRNLHEMFARPDSKVFYDNYIKAIQENSTVHFEGFSHRTNKWFAVGAFATDNGLSVHFKDVTDRKAFEEKIKKSELSYRSLFEQAADIICMADKSFRFTDINPSGCRMFGYTREEFIQLSFNDVLLAEDLLTNPIQVEDLKAGKYTSNERRIVKKNGEILDLELSGKMVEDGRIIIFGRDISERKKSESLIKESEAKFRSFFESSMDGILLTVTDGEILAANPAACEIFKMTEEEICAAGRFGITDLADPRVKILIEERQRTGKVKGEITLLRKDGSKFEAELTSAVFTDALGKNRTSMIVRDITERKKAELKLRETIHRYNLISQATNDMVWDWDLVTGKVYRNREGWKKLFRSGDKTVENELIDDWDNRIHPDDKHIVQLVSDEIKKSEKDFFEVECRMLRDDGTYAYVHDRGNIIRDNNGKALRLIGATQDITRRKEAELQVMKSELHFRSLVQNSSDLTGILNERGYFLYCSHAVKKILGYEPEYMLDKNAFAFVHADDINILKDYLSKDENYTDVTLFRFKNAQGEWRWLESKVTDMSNNPDVQGYIFNARDVTERKIAEAEIEKLSIIARETNNAVIITDTAGEIVWVNEAFTNITEYESDEAIGRKPGDFLQGEETSLAVVRFMHNKLKKVEAFECDILNYSKSGRKYWLRIQCQPQFNECGKLKYFFAMQTDISKEKEAEEILKNSEERYRYLFNNNPASIIIWDIENFEILEVNETTLGMYGYNRKEFLSKTILDLRKPQYCDKVKEFAAAAKQKHDFVSVNTWKHLNKQGEEMYMNIASHRIQFKGRDAILALATNITEKIFLEKELENERLIKHHEITAAVISAQEQERQELGSELHDNINQILAGSRLYLGLARKELNLEHPYLTETDTLINTAITEIRNLSHSLIPPSLHESELMGAIGNIMEVTQKTSGIKISLQAHGFDESLLCDKLKLSIYRIMQEQFNNILKHAQAEKIIVRLIQDKEKTVLSIKDDGVGFDSSKKPTGVGLMNIKTRASLFNGEITVISSPGNGCELRVLFN